MVEVDRISMVLYICGVTWNIDLDILNLSFGLLLRPLYIVYGGMLFLIDSFFNSKRLKSCLKVQVGF